MQLAAAGLALILIVVLASAAIRLGQAATPPVGASTLLALRAVHRTAASLEVVAVLWLGWLAWRARLERPALARGVALALGITVALSALGIFAGRTPPPAAALGNLLGGLALAALFAWLVGSLRQPAAQAMPRSLCAALVLLGVQCLLGARLALFAGAAGSPALPAHAMHGLALASGAAWLALRRPQRAQRRTLFIGALIVRATGFTALQFDFSLGAALVHAVAAALLVVAVAYARPRFA